MPHSGAGEDNIIRYRRGGKQKKRAAGDFEAGPCARLPILCTPPWLQDNRVTTAVKPQLRIVVLENWPSEFRTVQTAKK